MWILKIFILRIKQYFILFFKYYLLFNKYFKWFNFLFMLWIAPMDFKNIYEIFNALVNGSEVENLNKEGENKEGENKEGENKEPWLDNERKIALATLVIVIVVCVWYLTVMGGSTPGLDNMNRVLPEELDVKPSLLDENYNVKIVAWEARQEARQAAQAALDALNSAKK